MNLAKRNLRVTKWMGAVPAVAVCRLCGREFEVSLTAMKRVADAQASLTLQFDSHKCKDDTTSGPASGKR